jgi:hypothetical protein
MSTTTDQSTPSQPVPGHATKHPGNGAVPPGAGLEAEPHDRQIVEPESAVLPIRSIKPTAGPQEVLDDIASLVIPADPGPDMPPIPIGKPTASSLDRFKSKRGSQGAESKPSRRRYPTANSRAPRILSACIQTRRTGGRPSCVS